MEICPQVEQSVLGSGGYGAVVNDSEEEAAVPVVRAVGRFGRECEPYILPLFPLESVQMMGREDSVHPSVLPINNQWLDLQFIGYSNPKCVKYLHNQ